MEISFENKRILVTGAGQGIGREIARALSQSGAHVVALSRTPEHLESLQRELAPAPLTAVCVDIADWDATRAALSDLGAVVGLVNNAAVACLAPFVDIKPEDIDKSFAINLKAVINISQIVVDGMIKSGRGGSIVNISSQTAMAAIPEHAVYSSTKGALDQLSRTMALELGPHNIRTNCVNPTVVMTAMGRLGMSCPEKANLMLSKIPMGKFAETSDVAHAVLFLLTDQAAMINGVSLPIDGGFTAS